MTPQEQEQMLGEIEERVGRLRVLYEQYFLGYEKLEPLIPRKEVDRRLALLRKESLRNTALRFRFNVVNQKYNTFSMYWTRISRQIEDGTYKRHLQKAKKILDGGADKREVETPVHVEVAMEDFGDADLDALLAEADAAIDKVSTSTTAATAPHSQRAADTRSATAPATSFVVARRTREVLDELPSAEEDSENIPLGPTAATAAQRAAALGAAPQRTSLGPGAAAPGGPKKLVRRKDGTIGPLDPSCGSSPDLSRGSSPDLLRASSPALPVPPQRPPAQSARPTQAAMPPPSAAPPSSQRLAGTPVAPPSVPKVALPAMPKSAPRIQPIAEAPRTSGAPPSSQGISAAPPSAPRVALPAMPGRPAAPPSAPGQPSTPGRAPAAAPAPAPPSTRSPSSGAAGGPPPVPGRPPPIPPAARPTPARPPVPPPPPSAPRPPLPSAPGEAVSQPRPQIRVPLPSQTKKSDP